jgi:aminopeptidase
LFGTPAMAKEAGMTLEEYRNEIIKACYLEHDNPIKKWKETVNKIDKVKKKLDNIKIQWVNIK